MFVCLFKSIYLILNSKKKYHLPLGLALSVQKPYMYCINHTNTVSVTVFHICLLCLKLGHFKGFYIH